MTVEELRKQLEVVGRVHYRGFDCTFVGKIEVAPGLWRHVLKVAWMRTTGAGIFDPIYGIGLSMPH